MIHTNLTLYHGSPKKFRNFKLKGKKQPSEIKAKGRKVVYLHADREVTKRKYAKGGSGGVGYLYELQVDKAINYADAIKAEKLKAKTKALTENVFLSIPKHITVVRQFRVHPDGTEELIYDRNARLARGKAKKDVGHGGLDEWFSGHGGAEGKGEKATWGDWVAISPVEKTLSSGKKVKPGDIVGPCGISDDPDWKSITNNGKDPLKCMPRPKAHKMPKKERAEKAKAKMRAEKKDTDKSKKPTLTPTFDKKKKKARRAIQLDRAELNRVWRDLSSFLYDYLNPERSPNYPLPQSHRSIMWEGFVKMPSVRGEERFIKVMLKARPSRRFTSGGEYYKAEWHEDHTGNVVLFLNSKMSKNALWSNYSKLSSSLRKILVHELTHAVDYFSKSELASYAGSTAQDWTRYYNHPMEVRAKLGEVQDTILDLKRKRFLWNEALSKYGRGQKLIDHLLSQTYGWRIVEPYLSSKNKRRFYQVAYRTLSDLGVFDPPKSKKASMNVYKTLDSVPLDSSTWTSLVSKTPAWLDRDYPFVPQPDETCTVKELAYLARLAKLRAKYAGFIKAADEDILEVFKSLCAKLGVVAPWDALKKRTNDVAILVTKLKWSYNRPRPYQAALKHGVNFKPMSSVSAQSPSYPSGHTVQSFVLANDLASFAPQHRHAFLRLAEKISASRMIAGYHFPSDIQFGRTIFQNIAMPAMPASMKYAKAEKYKHINFKPPQSVAKAAERGLEYRRKAKPSDRGGLTVQEAAKEGIGSGVQRASNLKNRSNVSPKVIKQMVAFFSRHEKNKAIGPENRGTPWKDKGHVAWLLWGGDPGKAWANKVLRQMEAADEKEKKRGKTARRPIQVDRKLTRKLANQIYKVVKRGMGSARTDYDPLGNVPYVWSKDIRYRDVRGHDRGVTVKLIFGPVRGSSKSKIGLVDGWFNEKNREITLRLNSRLNRATLESLGELYLVDRFEDILAHELAHAMDVIASKETTYDPHNGSLEDYYNSPHEVKAYLVNIVAQVVRWLEDEGFWESDKGTRYLLNQGLANSSTWGQTEKYLNARNRRHILKAVYRAIEDFIEANSVKTAKSKTARRPIWLSSREKTAARPIRLDRGRIEKLLDRLYRQLEPYGSGPKRHQRVGVQRDPIAMDSIVVRDVFGNDKKVHVALTAKPGGGGSVLSGGFGHFKKGRYKGEPIIIVQMNGSYDWEGIAKPEISRKSLRIVLMHELTHAADKLPETTDKGSDIPSWGEIDPVEYSNNPAEVRAYMREIYEEIHEFVHKVMDSPLGAEWGLGGTITRAIRSNENWKLLKPHLTRQNRNRILKGLVTAFQDEGLGEGDKEAGGLFKSRARLASRFVTDDSGREHKLPSYLYHVTYLKDLDSIQSRGIRAGRGQTFGGGYGGHSSGRVFFAEEDGVDFWFSRYGMLAENKTDTPEDGWWPVVLRVPTSKIVEKFNYDIPGSKDSRSLSVFVEPDRGISSNILEVFDPFSGSWTSLNSIDVDHWLDKAQSEGAEEDSYGEDSWIEVDFDYFAP